MIDQDRSNPYSCLPYTDQAQTLLDDHEFHDNTCPRTDYVSLQGCHHPYTDSIQDMKVMANALSILRAGTSIFQIHSRYQLQQSDTSKGA